MLFRGTSKLVLLASLALVAAPEAKRVVHDPLYAPFQQSLQIKPCLARKLDSPDVSELLTVEPETPAMSPPNEHDQVLALYITREELTELRKGFIQFGAFVEQQSNLNKFFLDELKELRGLERESEDTKKNLQIADLRAQLEKRDADAKEKKTSAMNTRVALYAACVAIGVGVLGGGCSLAAAWMSYRQPSIQTINTGPK